MLTTLRFVLFAYAALLLIGGFLGFTEKGSVISLAAGVVCGLLAGAGAALLPTNPKLALGLAAAGAVLVLGGQLPRFLKAEQKKIWPGGVTIAASVLALALTAAAWTQAGKGNP